jgi:REP element-mobilizing transposase RayT
MSVTPLPKRKPQRLDNYDYNQKGAYHIIISAKDRKPIFGKVVENGINTFVELFSYGKIVQKYIENTEKVYEKVFMENYIIMPNHVHLLILLTTDEISIITVITSLKRLVNRDIGFNIWHRSYYDRILRNEEECRQVFEYINFNPLRWNKDEYYI